MKLQQITMKGLFFMSNLTIVVTNLSTHQVSLKDGCNGGKFIMKYITQSVWTHCITKQNKPKMHCLCWQTSSYGDVMITFKVIQVKVFFMLPRHVTVSGPLCLWHSWLLLSLISLPRKPVFHFKQLIITALHLWSDTVQCTLIQDATQLITKHAWYI